MPTWFMSRVLPGVALAALLALGISYIDHHADARGYARAKATYELDIARLKVSHINEIQKAKDDAKNRYDEQSKNASRLSESLIASNRKIDALEKQLNERAHDVSTQYRPQPGDALQPLPAWTVTHGWVCDYNRSIGYDLPDAGAAAGGTANPSCSADPFTPSGVTAQRILEHHEEYGAYCRKLEEQLNGILDYEDFIQGQAAK